MVCRLVERASLAGARRVVIRCDRQGLTFWDDAPGQTLKQLAALVRGWEKTPTGTPLEWCRRLVVASRRQGVTSAVAFTGKLTRAQHDLEDEGTLFLLSAPRWKGDLSKHLRRLLDGRFEELSVSLDGSSTRSDFLEGAQKLGSKSWDEATRATLYLVPLDQASKSTPGFYLDGREPGWLGLFADEPWAALARIVVTGPFDPDEPRARAWLRKLGELARRHSGEMLMETSRASQPPKPLPPCPPEVRDTVTAWLESSRFEEGYRSLGAERPPMATLRQLVEGLGATGGQASVEQLAGAVEIPGRRVLQILRQAAPLFAHDGRVALSTSFDGRVVVLDLPRLVAFYDLAPDEQPSDRSLQVKTSSGEVLAFAVPITLEPPERRVLEAMGRHGKMNERELASALSTRRVGGLMETLISRLAKAGWTALVEEGEGPEGRVYALRRELIA